MKFVISLFILLSIHAKAQTIAITYHDYEKSALAMKGSLVKMGIPADFIALRHQKMPCKKQVSQVKWQLCIDELNTLYEVHGDTSFKSETLKIFLR